MKKIRLSEDTISLEDLTELSNWLLTNPRLTKGELTEKLEEEFAKYVGTKHSVFVNSGSSAILLMMAALIASGKLNRGSRVVVPNLSWSTDVSSVLYAGLDVVFCDCNLGDLSVDLGVLEDIFKTENISALLLVEVLGLVPNMKSIQKLCDEYGVILLEDTCESMGSEYEGKKLGSFGYSSVFSTYFGHHISTIEGGFVCTDDYKFNNILRSMRSHGWDRDLDKKYRDGLRKKYCVGDYKARYTFYYPSFNFRATDLQAFIGLGQMKKVDSICGAREKNYNLFKRELFDSGLWSPTSYGFTSNFAYPVISTEKNSIVSALEKNGVETRPLIAGDMRIQPYVYDMFGKNKLDKNSKLVDEYGFYVPNNPSLTEDEIIMMCNIIKEFS